MKNRYEYFKRQRLLAIDPINQGFGFVVLEDDPLQLVDWGVSKCGRKGHSTCSEAVSRIVDLCKPTVLVIEAAEQASSLRKEALLTFVEKVGGVLDDPARPVYAYGRQSVRRTFRPSGGYTKQQIAELLAARFPEIAHRLPPPRQVWEKEDPRMSIFDALALALTDLSERVMTSSSSGGERLRG